jgi:hypothetical protein
MALNKNAKKWVRALRSGKFKQAKNVLATLKNTYCCLGVACELARKDGVRVSKKKNKEDGCFEYSSRQGSLPPQVQMWLGLGSDEGVYTSKNGRDTSLVVRNDTGKKFAEIADIIESEPEGLFAEWV